MRNALTLYLHESFQKDPEEIKEIILLKSAGDCDELQKKYFSLRSSPIKSVKQYQEIEEISTGEENFETCFSVIFGQ